MPEEHEEVMNNVGEWVPAIPLPFYTFFWKSCTTCWERFFTTDGYRGHYALVHILKLDQ